MKRIWLILLLTFLQMLDCLYAQSAESQNLVKTRLVHLGVKKQIRDVGLWIDGAFTELWIPSTYFPEAVEYAGPNPITLVSMGTDEEGNEIPVKVGQAQIPEGAEEVLLLLLPLPPEKQGEEDATDKIKAPLRFGIKVVDFSPAIFPESSFLLWNLSGRPLVGTVGGKPFRSEPNRFELLQPELQGKARALDAKILYADDPSQKSYSSRKWFLSPGQKYMVVMISDPENPHRYLVKPIRY